MNYMRRFFLLIVLSITSLALFAQEEKEYVIEDDGSISFHRVIQSQDNKSKDELFPLIEAYFAYSYNDGKSVIQTVNKERSYIIGSGIYSEFDTELNEMFGRKYIYSTPHVIRIDCKDGRIRVIITVTKYDIRESNWMNENRDVSRYSSIISTEYPFIPAKKANRLSSKEERWESVYNKLRERIVNQFAEIERTINQGNSILENEDW